MLPPLNIWRGGTIYIYIYIYMYIYIYNIHICMYIYITGPVTSDYGPPLSTPTLCRVLRCRGGGVRSTTLALSANKPSFAGRAVILEPLFGELFFVALSWFRAVSPQELVFFFAILKLFNRPSTDFRVVLSLYRSFS